MPSADDRVRQAARADGSPETMRELARDPDIIVRAALAINGAAGAEIETMLTRDADDRVRALLSGRIARLLPSLATDGQNEAAEHVRRILGVLARDQAARVRVAIADEIKALPTAPHDLVLLLAQDSAVEVSAPILLLSPVLTDNDLLNLLATPPFANSAESIAARPQLSAAVADAIVAYAGAPAIRTLLSNQSACIQESTLDALIGRAPNHADWHAPLVHRPNLSSKAIRALSEFIAIDLLRILAARADLHQHKLDDVRQRLAEMAAHDDEAVMHAEAQRLHRSHALSENLMLQIANKGDSRRLTVFLAVAAGVPVWVVDRVVDLRSAKALVSLVWSGGFSMRVGVVVQTMLAQFAPNHALLPTETGEFPLTAEEMEWQMELMHATPTHPSQTGPTWAGHSG